MLYYGGTMKISHIPEHIEQLTIMNVPEYYKLNNNHALIVCSKAETDFWLKTHYGFQVMNGHVFYTETMTDFQAEVQLRMNQIQNSIKPVSLL